MKRTYIILVSLLFLTACGKGKESAPPVTTTTSTTATISNIVTTTTTTTNIVTKEKLETTSITITSKTKDTMTENPSASTSGKKTTTKKKTNTTTTKKIVRPTHPVSGIEWDGTRKANPDTGISWDGVSPIVYTYKDGTTGTEKKAHAIYESFPFSTLVVPGDSFDRLLGSMCSECGNKVGAGVGFCSKEPYDRYCHLCGEHVNSYACHSCSKKQENNTFYCEDCGKIGGDPRQGFCCTWLMIDECLYCGETGIKSRCHTCSSGCKKCGKAFGDGRNNTCYSDYFNPTNCPSCKVLVPIQSCHTCSK